MVPGRADLSFSLQGALINTAKEEKAMSKKSKKGQPLTREQVREIAAKFGIGELPRDHPVYSESPSITFVNRPPKPSKPDPEDE